MLVPLRVVSQPPIKCALTFLANLLSVDYNTLHVSRAASLVSLKKSSVLVVGCNTGKDCRKFIELGAKNVFGIDIDPEIGQDFTHPRVTYLRSSIEKVDLCDDKFDLVFAFATMEHVRNVVSGFNEMARLTRKGGWIYSVSSPLWLSPYGHHKSDIFQGFPWIHLYMTRDEILDLCKSKGLVSPNELEIDRHVDYMLYPVYFNLLRASTSVKACSELPGFSVMTNEVDRYPVTELSAEIAGILGNCGISPAEALAVTHTYIGSKGEPAGGPLSLRKRELHEALKSLKRKLTRLQ